MEHGQHKDLVALGGVYTELYETQFKRAEAFETAPAEESTPEETAEDAPEIPADPAENGDE